MLSKEEIEKLEELSHYCALKNIDREDSVFGEFVVTIQKIRNYIEQVETDKQKLIEKLEEVCEKVDDEMADFEAIDLKHKILEVLKGEKE